MNNRFFKIVAAVYDILQVSQFVVIGAFVIIGIPAGLLTLASLVYEERFDEAATQYILVATFVAVIGFVAWVRHDAIESSQRFEKHLRKKLVMSNIDGEKDDPAPRSASEHIRPAPGRDR